MLSYSQGHTQQPGGPLPRQALNPLRDDGSQMRSSTLHTEAISLTIDLHAVNKSNG